ncbi:ketosynthase [Xanthomonas vesicatoria]|uniref:ketosynthase n=1 Tax=Xanthomonas vesicatoria TaxID=56460 RepID=UPI000B23506C|nr:ketosynthase [Xanthomonas vesicatoria]MCC8558641.1 ketosynthase [Xanthomonas vesicatoria]MCC8600046.1 ketosynthase [Xanthomonas vesicatoria]MCC8611593.1 ketosynthase [Xanthomonas vesicatoria]MCC8673178.1 ketosynthase [Xanthomonas vesicatoria]MCC8679605.1 ketosynthase [Xanthomonas vesicatoria]
MLGLGVLLAVAYSPLAHWANASHRSDLAVIAGAMLVLMVLIEPMVARRAWAWALVLLILAGLGALWRSPHAMLVLAAPPVVFTGWVAWFFGRSLRHGRTPLITRIVEGLYGQAGMPITPAQRRYTRRLTLAWSLLLCGLTLLNLVLALCAEPSGVLAQLGYASPLPISDERASLFANLLVYGVVGGFFIGEYLVRGRWFPQRPYRNLPDFLRQMARLGPDFWRDLLR